MAIVKSKLIKELKKSYPNFLSKDLEKLVSILLNEIKNTLKRGERVELRGFGTFQTNIQKEELTSIVEGRSNFISLDKTKSKAPDTDTMKTMTSLERFSKHDCFL